MFKVLLVIIISLTILSGCHGCSFIKDRLGKKNRSAPMNQQQEVQPEQTDEPIPVNPHHS